MTPTIHKIGRDEVALLKALNQMFGRAFDDQESYAAHPPSTDYLERLLSSDTFIALVALKDGAVIGGIAAYELRKFEQERSEIYIYDLAVISEHRREGIATQLIEALKRIGAERGAYVIYVQADKELEDQPAIELYSKLGTREDVFHFDIEVAPLEP